MVVNHVVHFTSARSTCIDHAPDVIAFFIGAQTMQVQWRRPFTAAAPASARRPRAPLTTASGFASKSSSSSSKSASGKQQKLARYFGDENPDLVASSSSENGWFEVPDIDVDASFASKPIQAVILATGRAICLYKVDDKVYCSDANSTAFKYPLADANLLMLKTGPAVETRLDGTTYDLATGKVLAWCPKNNPLRAVLGSLKDKSAPEDLPVHSVRVEGKKVMVKLST